MTVNLSRRRHLGILSLSLLPAFALSACGGAERDEFFDPKLLTENQVLQGRAELSVSDGLVGTVYASQHDSAEKLYQGKAGRAVLGGAALTGSEAFYLASLSKSMTAAMLADAVERRLLRWDSRPAELLPELRAVQHPAYASVTLAQLLDHLSGLPAFNDPSDLIRLSEYLAALPGPLPDSEPSRRRLVAQWMMAHEPAGQPGQDFVYSNGGYAVAGAMLEAATGQDFESLMRRWAAPLGLNLQWLTPSGAARGHDGATPAELRATTVYDPELQPWVDVIKPAGDLWMTPAEYARWLSEHQRALQGQSHRLPGRYVQRLRDLPPGGYALGWEGARINGRGALVHSGADKGFMGLAALAQDGKSSHFALTNTLSTRDDGSSWVLESLNAGLLAAMTR